jgi:hypothetical protein
MEVSKMVTGTNVQPSQKNKERKEAKRNILGFRAFVKAIVRWIIFVGVSETRAGVT